MRAETQQWNPFEIVRSHLTGVASLLERVDGQRVERVAQRLRRARDEGATIYVAGNGGSASTAAHFVNDLGKATKRSGRMPVRVMGLADNVPWLTALGNDEGYERVFAGQLENFAKPGDVLVVISASGNSTNLVRAVDLAKARGVSTIGLLGFDGGVLKAMTDEAIHIPTEKGAYEVVEDCHHAVCHALARCLIEDRPFST